MREPMPSRELPMSTPIKPRMQAIPLRMSNHATTRMAGSFADEGDAEQNRGNPQQGIGDLVEDGNSGLRPDLQPLRQGFEHCVKQGYGHDGDLCEVNQQVEDAVEGDKDQPNR